MSRLDEQIERDFTVIADRVSAPPSPDAWAAIQQRIAERAPHRDSEIIMLTENTVTRRRWPVVAAAAAVVALAIAGIALVNRGDNDEVPANPPPPTGSAPNTDSAPTDSVSELPAEGLSLVPGRYTADNLGVPFEFEIPEAASAPWQVILNNQEAIGFGYGTDTFVAIKRIGSFYDADEALDPTMTGLGSIAPDGIDTWIEVNGLVVDQQAELTVGGRNAQFRQVRAPEGAGTNCPGGNSTCLNAVSSSADQLEFDRFPVTLFGDLPNSMWIIDLDDYEPIGIWASTGGPDHQAWLDELAPFIDSIVIGEPAPAVPGGTARISTFVSSAEAGPLPADGAEAAPGRYVSDALGVPVTFDLTRGDAGNFSVVSEASGEIQLQVVGGPAVEYVGLMRIGSFYDAAEALDPATTGPGSIPADDIDGWIESLGMTLESTAEVSVGGRTAHLRRVVLDTFPDGKGFGFSRSADLGSQANELFGGDWINAIWMVEMGEFEPVMIFAATDGADQRKWLDDVVQPIVDSIQFGEPAPAVPGGTARLPLRVTVSAPFTGVRTNGEQLADGSTAIGYEATSEDPAAGEIVGTGWAIPGAPTVGHDENVFTGSIEGLGTGTLSWTVDWTGTNPSDLVSTGIVTAGTGDFAGVTGTVTLDLESSEQAGGVDAVTGTNTFELVVPRSG